MNDSATKTGDKPTGRWFQNVGLWFGIGFLVFSMIFFIKSFEFPYFSRFGPGPGLYPRWLAAGSIVISLIYIWQSCTKQIFIFKETFPGKKELMNVASIFVSCMVFLLLLDHVGFIIAGFLLMLITFVRQYKFLHAVLIAALITGVTYLVFKVCFSVPLP